ncbi:Protein kinase domain-containing protein [Psidium guajava]|nr:Protein kinase domain-containing protein [Psidium guajava]
MEAYPFDSPPRSSNSRPKNDEQHRRRPSSSHISSLYSLRKKMNAMTPKRPCKKMPIAPMPPVPKRVYTVDAADFKAVVQELTGAPTMAAAPAPPPLGILPDAHHRHAAVATPPNDEDDHMSWPFSAVNPGLMSEAWMDHASKDSPQVPTDQSSGTANSDPFGLSAVASSHGWFSVNYHVLSPGTMASLEPINSVLYN